MDDFELFGLPRLFALDRQELDARRRALQAEAHPDKFASADAASRRLAMQWAVRINEAYARLKDPLKRAAYLCELNGAAIGAEDNTAMPLDFLQRQLALREAFDDAESSSEMQALAAGLDADRGAAHARLQELLDSRRDFASAASQVRALMFIERFAATIDERLEAAER